MTIKNCKPKSSKSQATKHSRQPDRDSFLDKVFSTPIGKPQRGSGIKSQLKQEDSDMSKKIKPEKAQVAKVNDTQKPPTPAELNYAANVISRFSEIHVDVYDDEVSHYFCLDNVISACTGKGTIDKPVILTSASSISASEIPIYIEEISPTPQVAEVLVNWFEVFYLPRIKKLPSIYAELVSDEQTWGWLANEADQAGISVDDWIRMYVLEQRDRLLDGIAKRINEIKRTIDDVLFDDATDIADEKPF